MNKKWVVLLLIMSMVLVGCEREEKAPTTKEISPYIGGNKGLVSEFLDMGIYSEESKMNEIFDTECFDNALTEL